MLTIARSLSSSKNLKRPLFLSLSILAQSLTNPSSSSSLSQALNPQPQSPIKTPPLNSFCYFSSIPSLSLTRDGNYDEATTHVVCAGCGVNMQGSDPKHPGFFLKPSDKSPSYHSRAHLVPVAHESEFPSSLKKGLLIDPETETETEMETEKPSSEKPVVCARCHSLRHYGKVKDPTVENLLPDFDFDHTIGRRLASTGGTRSVVLMVVDSADFDGSFPRKVAKLLSATIEENRKAWKEGKPANLPRMVLVVTKIDLLPSTVGPARLEHWVRRRAREGGAGKITSLHFVSAVRDWGLKNLVHDVVGLAGPRGCVWAVGAQNAGKSTLINAIGKCLGGRIAHLTEAPVPGTTLGIVRVEGVLPGQTKLFDTPGLLHPHQITTRLTMEEQRLVHIGKELKPRTYRIKAGHTIHIAGLMRLDIEESSVDSIYITVWASPYLPLHMGKTENAETMLEKHFGRQLQPPIGEKRVEEIGKWVRREFRVCGGSWDTSSVDIATSGLGWFAVGLKGEATLGVWTYEGVDVVLRDSLIPYRSNNFEDAGFTVSKIVSKADQASNKQRQDAKKKKQSNPKASVLAESPLLTVDADSNSC